MDARARQFLSADTDVRGGFWSGLRDAARLLRLRFQDDETLVHQARDGKRAAFDALEARYRARIRELAIATLRNEEEAARAVSQTFSSARRDVHAADAMSSTRAWLFEHALRAALAISKNEPARGAVEMRGLDPAALRHRMARAAFLLNERRAQRIW